MNPIAAKNELNLLASLIKGTNQNKNEPTLKLNLFPDRKFKATGSQNNYENDNDIIVIGTLISFFFVSKEFFRLKCFFYMKLVLFYFFS